MICRQHEFVMGHHRDPTVRYLAIALLTYRRLRPSSRCSQSSVNTGERIFLSTISSTKKRSKHSVSKHLSDALDYIVWNGITGAALPVLVSGFCSDWSRLVMSVKLRLSTPGAGKSRHGSARVVACDEALPAPGGALKIAARIGRSADVVIELIYVSNRVDPNTIDR